MGLWRGGDGAKVNAYLGDYRPKRHHALFARVVQALIELSPSGSEERAILESISNISAIAGVAPTRKPALPLGPTP